MTFRTDPEKCMPGDDVHDALVKDWPEMSNKSAVAFQKFTGVRRYYGVLVRKGKHIFVRQGSDLARCVYAHEREF